MKHKVIKDLPCKEMLPGVTLRSVCLDNVMVTFVDLEEGAVIPPHKHPHEQISVIVAGSVLYNVEGVEKMVKAGEAVLVPSGVEHSVAAVAGPALAYDSFSPIREDYLME